MINLFYNNYLYNLIVIFSVIITTLLIIKPTITLDKTIIQEPKKGSLSNNNKNQAKNNWAWKFLFYF